MSFYQRLRESENYKSRDDVEADTAVEDGNTPQSRGDENAPREEIRPGDGEEKSVIEGGGGAGRAGADLTASVLDRWNLRLVQKSPRTAEEYRRHVRRLLELVKKTPARLNDDDIQRYINTLHGYASKMGAMSAVRSLLKLIHKTIDSVDIGRPDELRPIEPITPGEFEHMMEIAKNSLEKAILLVLWDTGARNEAICSARLEDWRLDVLMLRSSVAKNKRLGVAPLSERTQTALRNYVVERRPSVFLFEIEGRQINRYELRDIVHRLGRRAGIETMVYPHLFRHMRALAYRDLGTKTDTVLNAMSWKTTKYYDERYGRRIALATLQEAQRAIQRQSPIVTPAGSETELDKMIRLLQRNELDSATFKVLLGAALAKKNEQNLAGYL